MQDEPLPSDWPVEPTEKKWDQFIPICSKDSDCPRIEGFVPHCWSYFMTLNEDGTSFENGTSCYLSDEPYCPGPVLAFENKNHENTKMTHTWEGTCTSNFDHDPVHELVYSPKESSNTMWLPIVAICVALLALIVPSCLCCCGVCGKKTCWYDCFRFKKNKEEHRSVQGAESEIYQALTDMTEEFGLQPQKIKAYVEVLEKYDVCTKNGLFFLT